MISVVIATHESERELVHTLAALVPGALAGVVREVIVSDAGSQDDTATVADVAGCRFMVQPGDSRGARLAAAAKTARADWLWFMQPGWVPEPGWIEEADRFLRIQDLRAQDLRAQDLRAQDSGSADQAAVLQWQPVGSGLRRAMAKVAGALGGRPKPQQGLLIAKSLYRSLGGHDAASAEPEAALLRKLGRRRIVTLSCAMMWRGQSSAQ